MSYVPGMQSLSPAAAYRSAARRGVSLLDTMLALAIVAVFAVVTVPKFNDARVSGCVASAAERLAADLNLARERARAAGTAVTVTFDFVAETYTATGSAPVDLAAAPYGVELTDLAAGGLTFDGYGDPDGLAATWRVGLACGASTASVAVDPVTGIARVE